MDNKIIKSVVVCVAVLGSTIMGSAFAKTKYSTFYVRNCTGDTIDIGSYNGADLTRIASKSYKNDLSDGSRQKMKCKKSSGKCWLGVAEDYTDNGVTKKKLDADDLTITKLKNSGGWSYVSYDKGSSCN